MDALFKKITTAVIEGELDGIDRLTLEALDQGQEAVEILNHALMPGMQHVGEEFKAGNMFVPEVLRSARVMQTAMNHLKPLLAESGAEMRGKILIGTVKGDLHDIGKNLVAMMCEGAGFEVRDLGRDIDSETFVEEVRTYGPDVLGMSALLTTTMRSMEQTIQMLEAAGLRENVKIIVGGAPITDEFASRIGADGYASNAAAAAELASELVAR
jgi:5-methyltetrahydrofolate--homocysteine methyltransferase